MARTGMSNIGLLALLLVTALTYSPCLSGDYVYDDLRFITQNPYMTAPFDPAAAFLDPSTMEESGGHDIYRPLRTLAFRIEHGLGGGNPFSHHVVGIALHLVNTLLVYLLLIRMHRFATGREGSGVASLLGAAFFALHPLQTESVAWISSRGDQLAALFTLLALNVVLKPRARPLPYLLPLTFALTLLACLSKESGMVVGALLLAAWFCVKPLRTRDLALHALVALIAAGVYVLIRSAALGPLEGQVPYHGGTRGSNTAYALYGLGYQASLILRPWFSNLDYQDGFFDAIPFARILILGCLFPATMVLSLLFLRRHGHARFGLLFFCICLLPTSSLIFPLRSLVNDRYLYLALAGIALLIEPGLDFARRSERLKGVVSLVFMVVLSLLAGFSFTGSMHWQNDERLWQAALKTHPLSTKARVGLGRAWFNQGRTEEALRMVDEALARLRPGTSLRTDTLYLKAQALTRLGRLKEAASCLQRALDESTSADGTHTPDRRLKTICKNLWDLGMRTNDFEGAERAAEALIRIEGESARNLWLEGKSLRAMNEDEKAEALLRRGASMTPACPELFFELADLLSSKNEKEEARDLREKGSALLRKKNPGPNKKDPGSVNSKPGS